MHRRSFLKLASGAAVAGCAGAPNAGSSPATLPSSPVLPKAAPSGRSIVVLGGGFGGITAALGLREGLPREHRITVVDRRPTFMMGLRKQWLLTGTAKRAEGERPLEALREKGIDVRRASVTSIALSARSVRTDAGDIPFDHLVVALGAEPRTDLVPGFSEAAFSMYDVEGVERASVRLAELKRGRVVIGVFGLPFKCPPAPYEAAMLIDELLRRRGVRTEVEVQMFTPQPMTLPAAGKGPSDALQALLVERKITLELGRKPLRVEGTRTIFEGGALDADVLLVVPPHRPPAVVKESGLVTAGDWVDVDPRTLRTTDPRVWAIGDVTQIKMANGAPFPKAGVFAEAQGRVVAANLASEILGKPEVAAFDGKGYCFVETGDHRAFAIEGEFLASPAPSVAVAPPSAEGYEKKLAFERDRLAQWF